MDNGFLKRPTLLHFEHIKHYPQCHEALNFIREASAVWKNSSHLGLVSEQLVQDLFHQLNLNPTKEQVGEMLRNAKLYSSNVRFCNGISFGEFSVLAADYRKFSSRTNQNGQQPFHFTSLSPKNSLRIKKQMFIDQAITTTTTTTPSNITSADDTTCSKSNNSEDTKVEVFLGGSCNPTTWRADVAIPELQKLGISFYNPQVSEWTPQLMKLEHQAKQKAKVLFFVIDSVTRASAGAIEVAHLAAQDQQKHLILVFHPYKRKQEISHEKISEEEYLDLSRNQKLLKQLVSRRGIPVLSNIQLGLQKIKNILAGEEGSMSDASQFVLGSRLISVRRSFDRVVNSECNGLTLKQCSQQLLSLGYRKDLVSCDNLKRILNLVRDMLNSFNDRNESSSNSIESSSSTSSLKLNSSSDEKSWDVSLINFEEFCVMSSYLSILQQEIDENCCVSPIKGTNLPPPPIFLSNTPEVLNQYSKQCSQIEESEYTSFNQQSSSSPSPQQQQSHRHVINRSFTIHESSSTSSTASMNDENRHGIVMISTSSSASSQGGPRSDSSRDSGVDYRDSGTSSPQPNENGVGGKINLLNDIASTSSNTNITKTTDEEDEFNEDSDSNDSVFSTSSSLDEDSNMEVRDIYLGGSCMLRTHWRRDIAIPLLKSRNISFYLPTIHDNLILKEMKKSKGYKLQELENSSSNEALMYSPRVLDSSRVLLFVITNETRSLAPMTLAAHYIGLAYNVVLCIQMLHDDCKIGKEKLTSSAIKDYNRGRTYLKDLAERQNIPVFSEIKAALECAIEKVKSSKPRCSV